MALGAGWQELAGIVLGQGFSARLGRAGHRPRRSRARHRLVEEMLFGVSRTDPVTFAAVAAVVCLVALLACLVPVRRALRADPMRALRVE